MTCDQELCPHWGGDGRVCNCVLLDIEPHLDGGAFRALHNVEEDTDDE